MFPSNTVVLPQLCSPGARLIEIDRQGCASRDVCSFPLVTFALAVPALALVECNGEGRCTTREEPVLHNTVVSAARRSCRVVWLAGFDEHDRPEPVGCGGSGEKPGWDMESPHLMGNRKSEGWPGHRG